VWPQPTIKDAMKSSRLIRRDYASSMGRCPGKGLNKTHATLSLRENSREIKPATEKHFSYPPSSGARETMNFLAASLVQNTGRTLSPQRKKVWGPGCLCAQCER
jgi:hypothetical protein